jgi:lysophospholipase L1-like esterase
VSSRATLLVAALVPGLVAAVALGAEARPLVAAPLVSRGRPVASSPRGGAAVVDGIYRTKVSWAGGHPTPAKPSWLAIDLGGGYARVLVSWSSSGNHDYTDQLYGAPVDYQLETSADSTNGADGTWRTAVTVTGNPVRTRAHAIDFAGQRWVRMSVTALSADVFEYGLFLDEIDVHDLSAGGDDTWVFFGDSIVSTVFDRAPEHQPSFAEVVAARHHGYFPAMIAAGTGSLHHYDAVTRIDAVLALNPDAHVIGLAFGVNDWDPVAYRRDLLEVVGKIRAAGRVPIIARVPFRTDGRTDYARQLNDVVDAVTRELGLVPGPDLYDWYVTHPGRLEDGLHPDAAGALETLRLWADAAEPLYPR